jgi:hypothetical protein
VDVSDTFDWNIDFSGVLVSRVEVTIDGILFVELELLGLEGSRFGFEVEHLDSLLL